MENSSKIDQKIEKQKIDPEIGLRITEYNDIFSSFDPRPFSQRALSDDFLIEAKNASRDKPSGQIELIFLIPAEKRNIQTEKTIKTRLREHFTRHYLLLIDENKKIRRKGTLMCGAGVLMIFIATYLSTLDSGAWYIHLLETILEPAGWFTGWTGLDEIYYTTKQKEPDLKFYEKMSNAEIEFISY